jgi:dihydropyrimidine dehydrogenase (NAD+) subunit PreA
MTWQHAVERLMLGARAVGLCSAVYMNGLGALSDCLRGLEGYLDEYGYADIDGIRGSALQYFVEGSQALRRPLKARIVHEQKCRECGGICVEKTAPECLALSKDGDGIVLDEKACTGCCLCYWLCPERAIEMQEE